MLQDMATITSKRQLTIPAQIFRKLKLKKGEKVIISADNDSMKIISAVQLVRQLAGSVKLPKRFKGMSLDEIIDKARQEHLDKA